MPRKGSSNIPFTDFYNRHCYKMIIIIIFINAAAGAGLFVFSNQTNWWGLVPLTLLSLGFLITFYQFVEDKAKVPFPKQIATLAVTLIISIAQFGCGYAKDNHYQKASNITDEMDIAKFQSYFRTLQENVSKIGDQSRKNIQSVIPGLEDLSKKYPYHRQVLYVLGIAQFEARQFEASSQTFQTLNDVSPNDSEVLFYLGISVKKCADAIEDKELSAAGRSVTSCGSPTAPWAKEWIPPSDDRITQLRLTAKEYLEKSLKYYFESPIDPDTGFGLRIARNLGWLCYQLSDGCKDEGLCDMAIEYHEWALGLKKNQHFSGNPRYVLALVNLGEIYRAKGDKVQSYKFLEEALRIHQEMLHQHSPEALDRDNRCVYEDLAEFYEMDGRPDEALDMTQKEKLFSPPSS
jgi:tetratricopeptide (TPR) repeat protein